MKNKKLKLALSLVLIVIAGLIGIASYYYLQGRENNYVPPPPTVSASTKDQVINDFTILSRAVDAYNGMNLRYPDSLSQLKPDFVAEIPLEPATKRQYVYTTDGTSKYTIAVSDPHAYELKELTSENGKIIEQ